MFDKASWPHIAADILGAPHASCEPLATDTSQMIDSGTDAWSTLPTALPQVKMWCSWRKNTIKVGVLIPRALLWPSATVINGSSHALRLDLSDSLLGVLVEGHMLRLACPAFMLCNDDVIRIMTSWIAGRGVTHERAMRVVTSMTMGAPDAVCVVRTLTRKAGLFIKDAPTQLVVEQAKLAATRMLELAQLAISRPLHIPPTVNSFMAWLRQRFFTIAQHPTSHPLVHQAYMTHAVTIVEGLWHDTKPSQIADTSHRIYSHTQHSHAALKHTIFEVLSDPSWHMVRRQLMDQALKIKRQIVSNGNSNSTRKSLHSLIALQALYMVFKFREDPAMKIWFSNEKSIYKTIMVSTFEDLETSARAYYMMYALSDELERRQFATILDVNDHGSLEVRNWVRQDNSGKPMLRLSQPEFFPAMLTVWKRHAWKPRDLPPWVHQIVEGRFQEGDLRVADMLSWHPECVRVLADVCGQSTQRARWLISWLAYHPKVVDPMLMPALFLLSEQEIAGLNGQELSAIYEHLERAPTSLRQLHESKTTTIVTCAVSRLGAKSFDLLDEILKDAMSADIMTHITHTIDNLPRLSSKRRALKREQLQALDHVQGAEHFGMLSVHEDAPGLQGALSHAPDESSSE